MPKTARKIRPSRPSLPIRIAVIAFDGITPFHVAAPCAVFGTVPEGHAPMFDVRVCSADASPLRTAAGFAIATEYDLSLLETADIVVMAAWHDDCRNAPPVLLDALRRAHQRGARIVGLCLGAFPLAEAGLLDGRTVATHWAFADGLVQRYPKVKVDAEVLYVDDGDVLTSAGVAAGLDCCLHLLRQLAGVELANSVARRLLVAPHRQGGQAQFIERPLPVSNSEGRFAQVLDWMAANLDEEQSIDALAARAAMSRRNFTRHFRQVTGTSVKQWLLSQRLAHAQRMLEGSDAAIEVVAQEAGFGTALSLRQHFQASLRTSPSAYRKQFRAQGAPG
ncbi:GlxA family transcriptional regulator [Massilia sp. erpn]|uniref:GlxA family transcriptional regulator n=1 Tax=Massilia sp. erpn TaxID=2738142 RepID=UPI00210607B1|nr:helix-turn-helix domain-containing protein [Massilia sp. erpn]UTY59929.1 helix-turn-helix domain-containing protein [Massilia sp. erpn]